MIGWRGRRGQGGAAGSPPRWFFLGGTHLKTPKMDLEELPTQDLLLLPDQDSTGPRNSSTPQELEAHPGLAKLLQSLGGFLGEDGLSLPLQQELHQAEGTLARAKERWLHQELLWRLLEELIRDPQNLDRSVLRSLEEELTRAQLRRGPREISELVPPPKHPQILPRLVPELQRRLREKREEVQNFLLGGPKIPETHPQNLPQNPQIQPKKPQNAPNLAGLLRSERLRLHRERLRERLLSKNLEKMRWKYHEVLSRCCSLLTQLCSLRNVQADLDLEQGQYLQAKGEALLLKSRALLTESHHTAEAKLTELRAKLEAYRALGPEFRDLALELGQIRQESARKRQAFSELCPPSP
ncbi:uncharacterized protein LOC116999758 isoform X2 [Catharus ustulatus]|uniref:uncharacterized protein LOC116999758 isoform X2 n=1 Tax=Catharus ustulatus TaxID=91951 RepID=UPI001408C0BC|nr:uncharacterized protein LOC116999758 isoform X2 [Catharus ustulatus]